MYKLLILTFLSVFFSNCKHHSLEQQTIEALHGKWEVCELRDTDPQTNAVTITTSQRGDRLSMQLLSPWYGGDSGINFVNSSEVIGKLGTDWTRFDQTTYTLKAPNTLVFTLIWADNKQQSAEIIKLDATELWLKKTNPFPQGATEIRLKRVQ